MYKIQIIKQEDGEINILDEMEISSPNVLAICNTKSGINQFNTIYNLRINEKQIIKQVPYQNVATKLKEKYSSFIGYIVERKIMFLVDDLWIPTEKSSVNSMWKIRIKRTTGLIKDITGYDYIIEMRQHWIDGWSEAQVYAAIMSQLLRINGNDGSVFNYTEDYHSKMIATFGAEYLDAETEIGNMLEVEIKIHGFNKANGQMGMEI